jgi:hypothetical protein
MALISIPFFFIKTILFCDCLFYSSAGVTEGFYGRYGLRMRASPEQGYSPRRELKALP